MDMAISASSRMRGMRDGLHRGCDLRHETYCRTAAGSYNGGIGARAAKQAAAVKPR